MNRKSFLSSLSGVAAACALQCFGVSKPKWKRKRMIVGFDPAYGSDVTAYFVADAERLQKMIGQINAQPSRFSTFLEKPIPEGLGYNLKSSEL